MMATSSNQPTIPGVVSTLRIILFALTGGLMMFAVVAIVIVNTGDPPPNQVPPKPFLSYVVYLFLVGAVAASLVVPRLIVGTQIRQLANMDDAEREADMPRHLLGLFLTKTIIGAAIFEGVGFFAISAYFTEESVIVLPVLVIVLVGILLHLPTASGVENWIERIKQRINEQQMLNP